MESRISPPAPAETLAAHFQAAIPWANGILLLVQLELAAAPGELAPAERTVKLLTVGNSFAYNATHYLRQLAAAAGHQVVIGYANSSGCSLEEHWLAVRAFEENPAGTAGRIYPAGPERANLALRELLAQHDWDYVTIQQASALSDDIASYRPYAGLLYDYIAEHAPGAEILVHETWAYRRDHPRFKDGGGNPQEMYGGISRAYSTIARELGARVVPVGAAFHSVSSHPDWQLERDESFDPATAVYPEVSRDRGTLLRGWSWTEGEDEAEREMWFDAFHANAKGRYLAACVFYEILLDESAVGNPFIAERVSAEEAAFLQRQARAAVRIAQQERMHDSAASGNR